MRILSLFDGIACARVALERLGIPVDAYYASEIDPKSMAVASKRWPDIVQTGDVAKLSAPDFPDIDLLIGGSPCTNLSIAGDKSGLEGTESKLFFEFLRLRNECRPRHWLLENVWSMHGGVRKRMDELVGAQSRCLNSSIWTAQFRKRIYWTDLPEMPAPTSLGLTVADIMEPHDQVSPKLRLDTPQGIAPTEKMSKGQYADRYKTVKVFDIGRGRQGERIYSIHGKSVTLTAGGGGPGSKTGTYYIGDYASFPADPKEIMAKCRRLAPVEAERLQGAPDGYTYVEGVTSDTDRYKMLGNGFTVPAIMFLLEPMLAADKVYEAATQGR
jgi:DNA-cytosine methyltransferase